MSKNVTIFTGFKSAEGSMFNKFDFVLEYVDGGAVKRVEGLETELYSVKIESDEKRFGVILVPKTKLELLNAYINVSYDFSDDDLIYVNGYQSWTTSREYGKKDIQKGLMGLAGKSKLVRSYCALFGDYDFQKYSKMSGVFHSYSYTYIKKKDGIVLLGTTSERKGFTVFHVDMNAAVISIQKDVEGVTVESDYALHTMYFTQGEYNAVFDEYFAAIGVKKPRFKRMTGYTSWYNYYNMISEAQLIRDLNGLSEIGRRADIFQIDDGYQTAVGDWTSLKTGKFPNGMKYLTDKIHAKGYMAGLWLAPFNAQKKSEVSLKHPDWLIKNPDGKPQIGCIAWGGAYTLDFYNPEVRAYIKKFFKVIFDEWNFDMVKLDFLYSVCLTPRRNKSRGTIMTEAMEFLRECVGDKIILGCGVPLFPAFGLVDFCRISCDMGKSFKDPFYLKHTNQEIFCTRNAMNNTIFRRHLDGRAFVNDPDVFYLRECNLKGKDKFTTSKSKLKFTEGQKMLLAEINSTCGNVLFVSDNVGGYGAEQKRTLEWMFEPTKRVVKDAKYEDEDTVSLIYEEDGKTYELTYDVNTGASDTEIVNDK